MFEELKSVFESQLPQLGAEAFSVHDTLQGRVDDLTHSVNAVNSVIDSMSASQVSRMDRVKDIAVNTDVLLAQTVKREKDLYNAEVVSNMAAGNSLGFRKDDPSEIIAKNDKLEHDIEHDELTDKQRRTNEANQRIRELHSLNDNNFALGA